jgi:hypothetical protein
MPLFRIDTVYLIVLLKDGASMQLLLVNYLYISSLMNSHLSLSKLKNFKHFSLVNKGEIFIDKKSNNEIIYWAREYLYTFPVIPPVTRKK